MYIYTLQIFVETEVKYVGRGLWTNNGRNARLAVTLVPIL